MASNSPLGSAREAGRLCSWGGGQLSGWTCLFHSETAPDGGLREEAGNVDAKTMDPTHRWPQLKFWPHHFPALPQFTHLLDEDSLL